MSREHRLFGHHPENEQRARPKREVGYVTRASLLEWFESKQNIFESNRVHVEIDTTRERVEMVDGSILAIPVTVDPATNDEYEETYQSWIVADIDKNKSRIIYKLTYQNILIEARGITPAESFELRQSTDQIRKKVTARQMYSYPGHFLLESKEVWPNFPAQCLIVGDPYQRCDREGGIIVDYEYADEILPDIERLIEQHRAGALSREELTLRIVLFFEDLHTGDEFAIQMMYGGYVDISGNPYKFFIHKCFQSIVDAIGDYALTKNIGGLEGRLNVLQDEYLSLRNGTWSIEDYIKNCHNETARQALQLFYELKEDSIHPDERLKNEYVNTWRSFLEEIPKKRQMDSVCEEKIRYITENLSLFINARSPAQLQRYIGKLQNLYDELVIYANHQLEPTESIDIQDSESWGDDIRTRNLVYSPVLSDTFNTGMMSDSSFGVSIPGFPMNRRVDGYLADAVDLNRRIYTYIKEIQPIIEREKGKIEKEKIPLSEEIKKLHISKARQGMVREKIHKQRTQKSTILHGFFPDGMPEIDPVDRIIALYSTSTHVWETFTEPEEFEQTILQSIRFLKPGGKYIAGPIDYGRYQIWVREGDVPEGMSSRFSVEALHSACQTLHKKGLIDFYFTKPSDDDPSGVIDTKDMKNGDVAGAIVITKK